jgi:hypothetical protein
MRLRLRSQEEESSARHSPGGGGGGQEVAPALQEEESCSPPQAALRATRRGASSATMAAPPAMTRLLPRPVINQSPVPLHLRLTRREWNETTSRVCPQFTRHETRIFLEDVT